MGALRDHFLNLYPYTDFHELNADWLIKMLMKMVDEVENFVAQNAIKYADPIQWDITHQYEKNTIVVDPITGTAYISNHPVPMGVALSNTHYWSVIFDLGRFITLASQNFANTYEAVLTTTATQPTDEGGWVVWNSVLYQAKNDIHVGDAYIVDGNIEKKTVEDFFDSLKSDLAQEVLDRMAADGVLSDLNTTDKSNLVAAINEEYTYAHNSVNIINERTGWLTDLNTTDKSNLVSAINEVNTYAHNSVDVINNRTGWLTDLNTTDKSNLVAAINEVNTNVGNLPSLTTTNKNDAVAAINEVRALVTNHHYLLVTDSYGDPAAVSGARTWLDFFGDIVGSSNITKAYSGGYGFNPSGYTAPFINLITPGTVNTGVPSGYDTNKVTDIIVLGGFNDRGQTVANIKSAINTFCTYARSTYANLRNIYIGGCGWSMNAEHLATLQKGRYIKAYSECGDYGAIYLSGLEYVMHGFSLYTAEDAPNLQLGKQYVHPNAVGSQRLAQAAYNAMKNGYATCHMPWSTFTVALKSGVTVGGGNTINLAEYQHDSMVCINAAINTFAGSFSIGASKTVIPLGTITSGYYNANDFTMIPVTGWVAGNGYPVNTPMQMYLQIVSGELQVVLEGNLADATTKSATYIVINPFNYFVNVLAS